MTLRDWVWPAQPDPLYFPESTAEILERLRESGNQNDKPPYDQILEAAKDHYAEPQERMESAERRATAILGGVPVAATVAIAGGTAVLDSSKIPQHGWRIAIALFLAALVLCLAIACYQALLATTKPFFWSTPAATDAFNHVGLPEAEVKLRRSADMLKAYGINDRVADAKVALAGRASRLLSMALGLLATVSVALGVYVIKHGDAGSSAAGHGVPSPSQQARVARARAPFPYEVRRLLAAHGLGLRETARRAGVSTRRLRRALRPGAAAPLAVVEGVTAALRLPSGYFVEARERVVIDAVRTTPRLRDQLYDHVVESP